MEADALELGLAQRALEPAELDEKAASWLIERLGEEPGAPLVPVSALDRALLRDGASFAALGDAAPDIDGLLRRSRKRLFPPARVKALHRWLRGFTGEGAEPEDARHAGEVLDLLRRVDPLRLAGAAHPVLRDVLSASFDAARSVEHLGRLLARLESEGWPADDPPRLAPHLRALRLLPVRVAPVDLLGPLRAAYGRESGRGRSGARETGQLALIDGSHRPLLATAQLTRAARDATADALDTWLAANIGPPEAVDVARGLRDRLRGGPGDDDAVDAVVRVSALGLLASCSAAELTRLEAALVASAHDTVPLLDYGDYLARAWRSEESVRAYHLARDVAPPAERRRIDERIAGREERLAGPSPRRRREPPDQLPLRF